MSFLHLADKIRMRFGRYKVGAPTTNSQPGAHTGNSRQYIPGYSDSNIVYLDTASGNDSNGGSTELLAKLTYASAATAAGSTKKIRVINNGASLSTNITKPTEMKRGLSGTISSSLTDPIASLTAAATPAWSSGAPVRVTWSPKLRKWYAVSSTQIVSSADGDTWTLEETLSGTGATRVLWVEEHQRLYVTGTNGKILYSADGSNFTTVSVGSDTIQAVAYSADLGVLVAGERGRAFVSQDGESWESIVIDSENLAASCIYALSKFFMFDTSGALFTSPDGYNWSKTNPINTFEVRALTFMDNVSLLVAADTDGEIWSSPDGVTWTSRRATTGGECFDCVYIKETGYAVICESGRVLTRSVNGTSWTSTAAIAAYGVGDQIRGISYSPLNGRIVTVGGNDGASTRINAYGPLYANTISANIAGFTVQAMQYSGTVTAYNCTMYQPGTTAALSLNACRVTEPGAHISNNAQAHFGTLFEGDAFFTSAPASQNAFALNCNTFGGSVYLNNSSATNYEQIRDNVIVGDFTASFAAPMLSGNLQGVNTNGILAKAVTLSDPAFVNTTDYKLKRLTNGDSQDSPLCNAAVYYVNEQGQPRDMGAWSEDDSENAVDYRYSYFIDKPAGNGIRPQKIVAASADQGMDGTWDSVNEPERASEYLTITYSAAVSREHVTIQDLLESLIDMTCEVSLTPDLSDTDTAVTVNGNHSIGDIVLNIDASSTIKAGMVLPIGGVNYFILYTASGSSPTKLVLHKPLESAVSDNTVITPQEPAAYGTYQYIPQSREIPRPTKMETDYVNGVSFKFVRQYPQI